ncbi:MAG: MarR family winged helix-turn-helix transcriptional regulator [Thermoleophilia bacterium]
MRDGNDEDDYVQLAALGAELHVLFDRLTRRRAGLTLFQFRLLDVLARSRPHALEPRDLGRALDIGSNHVTKLLDQLEGGSPRLVLRSAHESDRRRRLVSITQAGVEYAERCAPQVHALQERLLGGAFTPEERTQLVEMAGRLREAIEASLVPSLPPRPGP